MEGERKLWHSVVLALVCLAAAYTVLASSVNYADGDTRGTLLVSEQILRHGTITLDAYDPAYLESYYNFYRQGGHWYDYYPIGASIVALPVVAIAILAGIDVFAFNTALQLLVAALLSGLVVALLYRLARVFLPFGTSLVLAAAAWWGTSLASTLGTALWSHNVAIVFVLIALILLARMTQEDAWRLWPWLSIALFAGFVGRPTAAFLAPFAIGLLLIKRPRVGLRALLLLAALLAAFSAISLWLYHRWLPPYYWGERGGESQFLVSLVSHLLSPSRGLLIYTPVLVMIPLLALLTPALVRRYAGLLVVALGWPIVHLIVVSRHYMWYGGAAYGPRLMVDVLPGIFLAFVLLWPRSYSTWPARIVVALTGALAVAGIWIHSVQGLYNPTTSVTWNSVEGHALPEFVNDWTYPQFLHSPDRELQRRESYRDGIPAGVGYRDLPFEGS